MPNQAEYVTAAEDRIRMAAKAEGTELGPFTMTAIHAELNTKGLTRRDYGPDQVRELIESGLEDTDSYEKLLAERDLVDDAPPFWEGTKP